MFDEPVMRTTIAIDDDVLVAAKAIAHHEGRTLGAVISDLARKSLDRPQPRGSRNGVPLLGASPKGAPVTLEIVNKLRDDLV
jgi:hypothetical protein